MTARRLPVDRLPHWPRHLTRELAAAYVGVSPNVFDMEVAAGVWPRPTPRGAKGGLPTWDRVELDRRSDAALPSAVSTDFEERLRETGQRINGPSAGRQARGREARQR